MTQKRRRSDYLLSEEVSWDLSSKNPDELRLIREECEEAEARLSYDRRILQGKIDLLRAELEHRGSEGSGDLSDLLRAIPDIFAAESQGPGRGAVLRDPIIDGNQPRRRKSERLVDSTALVDLKSMDLHQIQQLISELASEEQALSEKRRVLHSHIDSLRAELTRRYKSGELGVEALLQKTE